MKRIDKAIQAYLKSGAREQKPAAGAGNFPLRKPSKETKEYPNKPGGVKRAAKLLMLLDKDAAADVFKHLSEGEVEAITREIAGIQSVPESEAKRLLGGVKARTAPIQVSGGAEFAKQLLVHSFGDDRGMSIYRRAVPIEIDNPFDFLDDLEAEQVMMLVKKEPAAVISVILPYLASRAASQVLESLPPESQMQVVKRIARMERLSPEALMKVAETLREKIRRQGQLITEEIDGPQVLAEILSNMSADSERGILEQLDDYNPELVETIRDKLFTINIIFSVDPVDLQAVLREFSEEELAIVLKGKSVEIRRCVLDNVSERRRTIINEEIIRLGAMRRRDVEKATLEFVEYIRELEEDGKIVLIRNEDTLDLP